MKVPLLTLAGVMVIASIPPLAQAESVPAQAVAVIEKRCGPCHGDQTAASGLRLVGREQVLKGGNRGPAVKPGSPADSLLFQAVSHTGKISMPPGGQLDPAEIEILRVWIEKGAEWPAGATHTLKSNWWAFRKPQRPSVPQVAGAATAIDAFLLEKLQAAGMTPAPQADKLTLIRRASFDLHGLPPTPSFCRISIEKSD